MMADSVSVGDANPEVTYLLLQFSKALQKHQLEILEDEALGHLETTTSKLNEPNHPSDVVRKLIDKHEGQPKAAAIEMYDLIEKHYPGLTDEHEQWGLIVDKYKVYQQEKTPMFGRDGKLEELSERLEQPNISVVSVCGIPGIGKSQLLRNFVWNTNCSTFMVDCRALTTVSEVVVALLERLGVEVSGDSSSQRSSLLLFLNSMSPERGYENPCIVLDDVSGIMMQSDTSRREMLQLLDDILKSSRKRVKSWLGGPDPQIRQCRQLRILVSSQEKLLLLLNECDYKFSYGEETHDLTLELLSDHDVSTMMGDIMNGAFVETVKACRGHPLFLSVLKKSYVDSGLVEEFGKHHYPDVRDQAVAWYDAAYNRLTDDQKTVLELLSLFPKSSRLKNLHGILWLQDENKWTEKYFYNKIIPRFEGTFWADVERRTGNFMKMTESRMYFTHPTIQAYLRNKFERSSFKHQEQVRLKFAEYHIIKIAGLGENSMTRVKREAQATSELRPSICEALKFIASDKVSMKIIEDLTEIQLAYILIFIDIYYDYFAQALRLLGGKIGGAMSSSSIANNGNCLSLMVGVLFRQNQFDGMEKVLNHFGSLCGQLSSFYKVLYNYYKGYLYTYGAKYSQTVIKHQEACLLFKQARADFPDYPRKRKAGHTLEISSNLDPRRQKLYWTCLLLIGSAGTTYSLARLTTDHPSRRQSLFGEAIQFLDQADEADAALRDKSRPTVLRTRLLRDRATITSALGDQAIDSTVRDSCYKKTLDCLEEERCILEYWGQTFSMLMAECEQVHGVTLKSMANHKSDVKPRDPELNEEIENLLQDAKTHCSLALSFFEKAGEPCMRDQIFTRVTLAEIAERFTVELTLTADRKQEWQKECMAHWSFIFDMCKINCEKSPSDISKLNLEYALKKVPICMKECGKTKKEITIVTKDLEVILKKFGEVNKRSLSNFYFEPPSEERKITQSERHGKPNCVTF